MFQCIIWVKQRWSFLLYIWLAENNRLLVHIQRIIYVQLWAKHERKESACVVFFSWVFFSFWRKIYIGWIVEMIEISSVQCGMCNFISSVLACFLAVCKVWSGHLTIVCIGFQIIWSILRNRRSVQVFQVWFLPVKNFGALHKWKSSILGGSAKTSSISWLSRA